jgi:hypothetical protein
MAEDWSTDVKKHVSNPDANAIAGIVRYCGIALQKRDSSLVSFNDKEEVDRVRANYLKNHLGRRPPVGVETADVYPRGGRERPTAFWWHVPRKKTWSMGCCARESGDAIWRSRLGN